MAMLVYNNIDPNDLEWLLIFENQIGNGARFSGVPYQRGYGIFSRIFKFLIPIFQSTGKELGRELLGTAARTLTEISEGVPIEQSLKKQGKASLHNMLTKGANATVGDGRKRRLGRKPFIVTRVPPRKRLRSII